MITKLNTDPTIPLLVGGLVLIGAGILCFCFPRIVMRYDIQLRRFVKSENEYLFAVRFFGLVFIFISVLLLAGGGLALILR